MMVVGKYSITYNFFSVQNSFTWYLTGVYVPHTRGEKLECCEEIAPMKKPYEGPWISYGDF